MIMSFVFIRYGGDRIISQTQKSVEYASIRYLGTYIIHLLLVSTDALGYKEDAYI